MCPIEEAYNTLEFNDFFLIKPVIIFNNKSRKWNTSNYKKSNLGEVGKIVNKNFSYSSEKNKFLSINQIKKYF